MDSFNYDNEIIEIGNDNEKNNVKEVNNKNNKKNKKSLKEKWNNISKKKKIIIIVIPIVILLIIISLVLYLILHNKPTEEPLKEEDVILENDNYRYENGTLIFLDMASKEIGKYECTNKNIEKCYVAKLDYSTDTFDRIISVNEDGTEIEKNSQIFLDNYVFIYDNDIISLYNITEKEKELSLKSIKTYNTSDNLVVIEDEDSKYGLIEITKEGYSYLIRCSYDNLSLVNNSLEYLIAKDKDKYYIIDKSGKKKSDNINNTIKSVNEDFIITEANNTYSLYNYKYEELISDYDYISIYDNIIILVKNNKLYLKDSDLNKLNEVGIKLENDNYVKKYVYDKNNKLINTLKSFDIEVVNNIVKVNNNKNVTEINIEEGKLSSNYNYISYLDGKLYFYSDEDKEDLIGSYTCNNKNTINSSEDVLSNCGIYSNDKGISGIYNNEYVFIYDNKDKDSIKYYLYDIKEKKNKGVYSSLEFINDNEINNNIKQIYTSKSYIIAKSATGDNINNYGVVEINSEKVSGKISFKYESIKLVNNYYLLINIDKSYSIYDKDFKKISDEFNYIEIFDNYYVGIDKDKLLNVYNYSNTGGILESGIPAEDNKFTIDFKDGFTITINNNIYKFDKNGKAIKEDSELNKTE